MNDSDLDKLFGAARQPAPVSDDLMARVMADADAHQPQAKLLVQPAARRGTWSAILSAIGGAGALAGLSTATLAGVWIGLAQPAALSSVTDILWADDSIIETVDMLPAFDDFLTEG